MNYLSKFLISILISFCLILFAVFSIQNITPISLKFFVFQSVQLPIGILLCLIFSLGMIFASIVPLLLPFNKSKQKTKKPKFNARRQRDLLEQESDPIYDWE